MDYKTVDNFCFWKNTMITFRRDHKTKTAHNFNTYFLINQMTMWPSNLPQTYFIGIAALGMLPQANRHT